jgi:ferredoxin
MIAPASFLLSDIDGTSSPMNEVVPPEQQDAVREAVHSCPEQAISIEE